jgi:hypothetical protein
MTTYLSSLVAREHGSVTRSITPRRALAHEPWTPNVTRQPFRANEESLDATNSEGAPDVERSVSHSPARGSAPVAARRQEERAPAPAEPSAETSLSVSPMLPRVIERPARHVTFIAKSESAVASPPPNDDSALLPVAAQRAVTSARERVRLPAAQPTDTRPSPVVRTPSRSPELVQPAPQRTAAAVHAITPAETRVRQRSTEPRDVRVRATPLIEPRRIEAPSQHASEIVVTIGRIDVRAIALPATPKHSRAGAVMMTLDDYMRQRASGAR